MTIYLPIAELPINILLLLGLGALGGILAGMFGIGGGFLLTPLLIFLGIPAAVAVATSTNQIIASSVSGFLAHWHRNSVDIKMGLFLLIGGLVGAVIGVALFTILESIGQIDLVISLIYIVFLGFIGLLMAIESGRTIWRNRNGSSAISSPVKKGRMKKFRELPLPFQTHFPRSELTVSAILPIATGVIAGMLVSLMGIGGGFIMIPAMIYILGMPTGVVVGTSLFQIIFITSLVTVLHAVNTYSVDMVLAVILIIGGVFGAQIGTAIGLRLPAEKLRWMLALIVLAVCVNLALGLLLEPENLYSVTELEE